MKSKKILFLGSLIVLLFFFMRPYYLFLTRTVKISPLKTLFSFNSIKKIDNKTNILILGIPGGNYDGPLLSDSITVANFDFKTNHLITVGIPRDIWSSTLRDRVNSAYAYGEGKIKGRGLKLARAEIGAIVGVPIQYGVVINFQEFKDLIDFLGGVDVVIERSFTDRKFPIESKENDECGGDKDYKCRYETVSFKKGKTHMGGLTALKFVRSRNAEGEEGSDFARNRRQQIIIDAVWDKVKDTLKTLSLKKYKVLYEKADKLILRDLTNQQSAILLKNIIFKGKFVHKNLSLPRDLFIVPDYWRYEGKYVLAPKAGDFKEVHEYATCIFDKEDEKICTASL